MVSLKNKLAYINRINESPKLMAFHDLLLEKNIPANSDCKIQEADELFFGVIYSIQKNDKAAFERFYNKKSKSNPSKDSASPFVNDDFLIFCLIIGITKFDIDKGWIKNIVSLRNKNAFTITFDNILSQNYLSTNNLPEIILIFFYFYKQTLITNDLLNRSYNSITENLNLFESRSDFHIICSIRAFDLIITQKQVSDSEEYKILKDFDFIFLKRIKIVAWFIQTFCIIILMYLSIELISINPKTKVFIDEMGSVLKIFGIIGLSQLGNIFPYLKRKIYELTLRLFGYPKALIKKQTKINA